MSQQASSSTLDKMAALKEITNSNDYSILVTGATGFIGKKLVERLATTGYKVTAMSRSKHPDSENVKFMCVATHPYISGVPHRIKYVREAYRYFLSKPDVIVMNGEQILDWYLEQNPEIQITNTT